MNKKMMLILTALIAATPVLQVAASADAMFYDIKGIVEDRLTGKDDQERLNNIQNALQKVKCYKDGIQDDIIRLHSSATSLNKPAGLSSIAVVGFGSMGAYSHFMGKKEVTIIFGAATLTYAAMTLYLLASKNISLYYNKKKITELNTVIVRLEAMEKSLLQKLYPDGYCGAPKINTSYY